MRRFLLLSWVLLSLLANTSRAQEQPSAPANVPLNASNTAQHKAYDPLLDLPPLPQKKITLIGGTVVNLDEVMNRMIVQPFGDKRKMQVAFDTRTGFFRDGKPISYKEIRQGQRIYLDTMLYGTKVFAKKIWIQSATEGGTGTGQIIDFDAGRGVLTVHDELSSQPVRLHITSATVIRKDGQPGSTADLVEGALVSLRFGSQQEVQQVTVLATPGATFSFAGRVTFLDLSSKVMAIDNRSDQNKYDVSISAIAPSITRLLREGVEVTVSAVFNGNQYEARQIDIAGANQ